MQQQDGEPESSTDSASNKSSAAEKCDELTLFEEEPWLLSDVVAKNIETALNVAKQRQQEVDDKILSALEKLENYDNVGSDFMATDFDNFPNYSKALEEQLKSFQLATFSKRYSSVHQPATYFSLPNLALSTSSPSAVEQHEVSLRRPTRLVHSTNDINNAALSKLGENFSIVIQHVDAKDQNQNVANSAEDTTLSQPPSLLSVPREQFRVETDTDKGGLLEITKCPSVRAFWDCVDEISKDLEGVLISTTSPTQVLTQTETTSSHLIPHGQVHQNSVASQTAKTELSAFEAYAKLKKELSGVDESQKTIEAMHKNLKRYRYLKDVSVAEYMSYKTKNSSSAWSNVQTKNSENQIMLTRKGEKFKLETNNIQLPQSIATTAVSPSRSFEKLSMAPSQKFKELTEHINQRRKNTFTADLIVKSPALIYSSPKSCSDMNCQLPIAANEEKKTQFTTDQYRGALNQLLVPVYSKKHGRVLDKDTDLCLNDRLRKAQSSLLGYNFPDANNTTPVENLSYPPGSALRSGSPKISQGVLTYQHSFRNQQLKPVVVPKRFLPNTTRYSLALNATTDGGNTIDPTAAHSELLKVVPPTLPPTAAESLRRSSPSLALGHETFAKSKYSTSATSKHMVAFTRSSKKVKANALPSDTYPNL